MSHPCDRASATVVRFGCKVTIARDDGRWESYRIVGEDEAKPSQGTLSYLSPVARALMGRQVGDVVGMGSSEAEIIEIKPSR
jgi:transcription elongation GreA/GreB family factor